jgi:hypothetical protein
LTTISTTLKADHPAGPIADHAMVEDFVEADPQLFGRARSACAFPDRQLIQIIWRRVVPR